MAATKLVIVESPAKAKTINRYLGNDYVVMASFGHVRDLPNNSLGVDLTQQFTPRYVMTDSGKKTLAGLKKAATGVNQIILATDPDREGEAIAWHLQESLAPHTKATFKRVVFHEVTANAIRAAFANPGDLDQAKVDAQQARRILDRLVGYQVSPLLWEHIQRGTSAGRVQSVALRLVCEREREILAFEAKEYWQMDASFLPGAASESFMARLFQLDNAKPDIGNAETANALADELENRARFRIDKINKKPKKRHPYPPFTTSTLQQTASGSLRFSPSQTMQVAQQLYEGVELGADGAVGLITYMRTDSVAVSKDAQEQARAFIAATYGNDYVPAQPNNYRSKNSAQAAHEAVRPTHMDLPPAKVAPFLQPRQLRLYTLIWNRFIASQMESARQIEHSIDVVADNQPLKHVYRFRATATTTVFAGFLKVYGDSGENDDPEADPDQQHVTTTLPELHEKDPCTLEKLHKKQCFTQPPRRFSEATLVRELDENGIGRPSTYASIVRTIQDRNYTDKDKGRLFPTELGFKVNDYLVETMPELMDIKFTAKMEDQLDKIEDGNVQWTHMLTDFYDSFRTWVTDVPVSAAPNAERISEFLAVFDSNITWDPPKKRGRRTYDDQKFIESLCDQVKEGKTFSDRQWQALLTVAARYAQQLPALEAISSNIGIAEQVHGHMDKLRERESNPPAPPTPIGRRLCAMLADVKWEAPVKRGKRVYDDKKFYKSLASRIDEEKALTPAQLEALKKLAAKYRSQLSGYDELAAEFNLEQPAPVDEQQVEKIAATLMLFTSITQWEPAKTRGKRTYDDKEFVDSICSQFESRKILSDRQIAAAKKVLSRYWRQIPNYEQKARQLDLPPPADKPLEAKCPECGQAMVARQARGRTFYGCSAYPKCKHTALNLNADSGADD